MPGARRRPQRLVELCEPKVRVTGDEYWIKLGTSGVVDRELWFGAEYVEQIMRCSNIVLAVPRFY